MSKATFISRASAVPAIAIVLALGAFYLMRTDVLFYADGYIYLAHARQFATTLVWGINPGEVSFSVTSPLWTIICALLYRITPSGIDYVRLVQLVGLLFMAGTLPLMDSILRRLAVAPATRMAGLALFAAVPFNGFFNAISAMETSLYLFLFFAVVRAALWARTRRDAALVGGLCGLLFLTRVEGAMCLPAFAVLLAISGQPRRTQLRRLLVAGAVFAAVVAPWQLYLYVKAGIVVPTSGKGRLYLYFPFDTLELADYLAQSLLQRLGHLGEVFRNNFIKHPIILLFGLLPTVGILGLLVLARFGWPVALPDERRNALRFLAIYNVLNLLLYLLLQPFLYQRYFIVALPSLIIGLLAFIPPGVVLFPARTRVRAGLATAVLACLAVINGLGLRYFDFPTRTDGRLIAMFRELDRAAGTAPCRLAAEPLGLAAYFTRCYVIDLGGLINPDIWPVWIAAGRRGMETATTGYAIARRADFVYVPKAADLGDFSSRFSAAYRTSGSEAIYRHAPKE